MLMYSLTKNQSKVLDRLKLQKILSVSEIAKDIDIHISEVSKAIHILKNLGLISIEVNNLNRAQRFCKFIESNQEGNSHASKE